MEGDHIIAVTRGRLAPSTLLACVVGCLCCVASVVAAETSHLAVQVVLPDWLPNPTVPVHVTNVKSCAAHAEPVFPKTTKTTDLSGMATFDVPGTGFYRIEVPKQGGWTGVVKCIRLSRSESFPTAYVQVQVKFAGPFVSVRD
jgi:hypothetical protein